MPSSVFKPVLMERLLGLNQFVFSGFLCYSQTWFNWFTIPCSADKWSTWEFTLDVALFLFLWRNFIFVWCFTHLLRFSVFSLFRLLFSCELRILWWGHSWWCLIYILSFSTAVVSAHNKHSFFAIFFDNETHILLCLKSMTLVVHLSLLGLFLIYCVQVSDFKYMYGDTWGTCNAAVF